MTMRRYPAGAGSQQVVVPGRRERRWPHASLPPGSLARRVTSWAAVVMAAWLVAGALLGSAALAMRQAQYRQSTRYVPAQQDAVEVLNFFVDQESGLRGFMLTGQETFLDSYEHAEQQLPGALATLRSTTASVPSAAAPLVEVTTAYSAWLDYADAQLNRMRAGAREQAVAVAASGQGKERFDVLRSRVNSLQSALAVAAEENQTRLGRLEQGLAVLLVVTLAVLAVVVVAGVRVLLLSVIGPVQALAGAARSVADGHLSTPIPVSGAPEITGMAVDVAAMRDRLLADADAAEQALHALTQHSPAVAALRQALTPTSDEVDGLVVAGRIDPAEGVLAGDWYDLLRLSPHRLAVVLGDVAGHGPTSAVLALRLKHALAAALRAGAAPADAVTTVSRHLADVPDELFATVLVVAIDTSANELVYTNAGHPAALLLATSPPDHTLNPGERATPVPTTDGRVLTWVGLPSTGPLLSPIVSSWSWNQATCPFIPGDTLLAFTDGLLEARDETGDQFGIGRVLDVLTNQDLTAGPRILDALAAAVLRHHPTRRDDQTLVYAHRSGIAAADVIEVPSPVRS